MRIRKDLGSQFCSERFRHLFLDWLIEQIEYSIGDPFGNGNFERCIRSTTTTNKRIVLERDKSGLSEILFSLHTARGHNDQSPAEMQMGRPHKIIGDLLKSSTASIPEYNSKFQLELNELPHDADFTMLVRERAFGSKYEPVFLRPR